MPPLSAKASSSFSRLKIFFLILGFLIFGFDGFSAQAEPVRYVAIGDSYTICQGVAQADCWPTVLTRHLAEAGIDIELVANPSKTGWRVGDAIERELPVFENSKPAFATLLIGVNDWVHGSGRNKFTSNLKIIMDRMIKELPQKQRLLIVTVPDFSCAPRGESYGYGRNIAKGISRYNAIIKKEAGARGLLVVDIFPLSQTFCDQPEMFVDDGIHPSAKQYALWEELIFPVALKILRNK
jgi:lysophospholipase L1-like esterase